MRILKYEVEQKLIDDYIKFKIAADSYLTNNVTDSIIPMSDMERSMRWQMCVKKIMEIHREICKSIGIEYSTNDEFYYAFHRVIEKLTELKG